MESHPVQTCYRHPDQPAGVICQRCDRPICPRCMHQASVGFHCPECAKAGKQTVHRGVGSLQARPVLTQALIGINLAVFAATVAVGGAEAMGGSITQVHVDYGLVARLWELGGQLYIRPIPGSTVVGVGGGEWYRMVTSGFLHYGVIHLAFNMYALWILGGAVEYLGGRGRLAAAYVVSLLTGSLGALLLTPDSFTAGASGAIFGLMGALLMAHRAQGIPFRNSPLVGILVLNLIITFGLPGISIGGHVGGLVGGAAAGWALFGTTWGSAPSPKLAYGICAAVSLASLVAGVAFSSNHLPV